MSRKTAVMVGFVSMILALDLLTKRWALHALEFGETVHMGGRFPITLALNEGAAFSFSLGPGSRWFFLAFSFVALGILFKLYQETDPSDGLRLHAVAVVVAGALGNLYDRLRWDRGVVDFLGPIDLGFAHFPIFNVADIAITTGAGLLLLSFWREHLRVNGAGGGEYPEGASLARAEVRENDEI